MGLKINVNSEIAKLVKVQIHYPDGGIGNVPVNKLHDWLYDDIVDVKKIQEEHTFFHLLLLAFLDPEKLYKNGTFVFDHKTQKIKKIDNEVLFEANPSKNNYYLNTNESQLSVLDTELLLQKLFITKKDKAKELIVAICANEGLHKKRKLDLLALLDQSEKEAKYAKELVKTILTGKLEYYLNSENKLVKHDEKNPKFIFPPIPNFIFTRDISVSIGNYLLITKPKFYIRKRETQLQNFIAENYFFDGNDSNIVYISEDDDFFQIEDSKKDDFNVSYEGGDIMMISPRHLLVGYSERTTHYAIQKMVYRLFWENIETADEKNGFDIISIIKIGEKRSQMHIDTILTHIREDVWVLHSPLSEKWQAEQKQKEWSRKSYTEDLKESTTIDEDAEATIFQFYLNEEGKALKKAYANSKDEEERKELKAKFKKLDFLLRKDENGNYKTDCVYKNAPKGLHDFLVDISNKEFGIAKKADVKVILSGGGIAPFDNREQWTDACNLLTLKSGVSVGYDRNYKTAIHFNKALFGESTSNFEGFIPYIVKKNEIRFDHKAEASDLKHIVHVTDLLSFIDEKNLSLEKTTELINSIENTLLLIPSNELSRARGGSHCMTMPIQRANK